MKALFEPDQKWRLVEEFGPSCFTENDGRLLFTADYTDNHFIIELDDIVIGAIDSLDEVHKNNYRLEINNLDYEVLIIAINIIIDLYLDIID